MTSPLPLPDSLREQILRLRLCPEAERQATLEALCREHPGHAAALREQLTAPAAVGADTPGVRTEPGASWLDSLRAWLQDPDQRYSLRHEVGRGGMGAVFKVRDASLGRHLAMKVIRLEGNEDSTPHEAVDPRVLERFLEEAQITGQLDHPGIVPVHELGVDARGRAYFTMKLVHGQTADEIFAQARAGEDGWSRTRALEVLVKVCDALAFAHQKGVIHRDLKPSNVMVGRFGEVYVMDWGLAKVLGQKDSRDLRIRPESSAPSRVRTGRSQQAESDPDSPLVTMDGAVVGTPSYMPLEQAEGRVEDLGPRSDVYAVGAMLYTLLTGHVPYVKPGTRVSPYTILRWVQEGPPRSVHTIDPTVPAELAAVCEKAMARECGKRYADMRALGEDLRAFLDSRVVRAYRTGAWAEARAWVSRNRGLAAALAAAVLVLLGGIAVSLHLARSADIARIAEAKAKGEAQEAASRAGRERDAAQEQTRLARRHAYIANVWAADASLRSHAVAEARARLEACDPELRGFEWHHLWLRSDSSLGSVRAGGGLVLAGGKLLTVRSDQQIHAWDPDSLASLGVVGGPVDGSPLNPPTLVGCLISLGSEARVGTLTERQFVEYSLAPFRRGREIHFDRRLWAPSVVSDGRRLFVADGNSDCYLVSWSLADGTRTEVPAPPEPKSLRNLPWLLRVETHERAETIEVSPDGSLLGTSRSSAIHVWDPNSWRVLHVLTGHEGRVTALAFYQQRILVSGAEDRTLRVWEIGKSEPLSVRRGLPGAPTALAVSPDGEHIVSASPDGALQVWKTRLERRETGEALVTLLGHTAWATSVAVTADSQRIVSIARDGTTRVWDPLLGRPTTELIPDGHALLRRQFQTLQVAADGRWLVGLLPPDLVRMYAADTGKCVRTWRCAVTLAPGQDASGRRVARCESLKGLTLAASPRVPVVAVACGDAAVRLLDCDSGEIVGSLGPHAGAVQALAMSSDGRRVAALATGRLHLWDVGRREQILSVPVEGLERAALALAPQGDRLAVAARDGRILWGREGTGGLATLPQAQNRKSGPYQPLALAWSQDGRRLFASNGTDVQAWDVEQGALAATLAGHSDDVLDLAASADGRRLVSAAQDGTVRIWETETFACVGVLREKAQPPVHSVVATPDGRRVVACSGYGAQIFETELPRDRIRARRLAATADLNAEVTALALRSRPEPLAEMLEAVAREPELAPSERESVARMLVEMAVVHPLSIERAHSAGWQLQPDSPARMWQRAEVLARQARVLAPDSGMLVTDIGMAQLRLGRYEEALATLQRAEQMNSAAIAGGLPEDTALLALACARLGRRQDAQAWQARLTRSMERPGLASDPGLASLRREVEELLAR